MSTVGAGVGDSRANLLSQDFLLYIIHLQESIADIEESDEKQIIHDWLHKMLEEVQPDVAGARVRNMAMSQLLFDIDQNKLQYPFNERASARAYSELKKKLEAMLEGRPTADYDGTPSCKVTVNDIKPSNRELVLDTFGHCVCGDGRTYTAIRCLSDGSGVFGYVAITVGDSDAQWLDAEGQPIATPEPESELLPVDTARKIDGCQVGRQTRAETKWVDVLKTRKPLDSRDGSLQFYKKMYETIERLMVTKETYDECTNPLIDQLLNFLSTDLKNMGVLDLQQFSRINLLSLLKQQIKTVMNEIENRSETIECATKSKTVSHIIQLPQKCCYDLVSNALWNEISEQRPGTKYMDALAQKYPREIFPIYFSVLVCQKQLILNTITEKYCKILNDMFADLEKAILAKMFKYKNAKLEWLLVHQVITIYMKERFFKDNLCAAESTIDETTDTFYTVIYNEMEMAQKKLKAMTQKNSEIAEQLPILKTEIGNREQIRNALVNEYEEEKEKLRNEINNEKRDILVRENTIRDLQSKKEALE